MVVNKRLPQSLNFNAGLLDEFSRQQAIYTYKYTWCNTKLLKEGGRKRVKKMRHKYIKSGICHILVKHQNEKKSCYMQTYAVNGKRHKITRLH